MKPSPSQWTIHLNNKPITSGDDVHILPGQANTLAVHSDKGAPPTVARLVRTLPDGSRCESEVQLPAASSHSFGLGPMTAPPRYEFEAGQVIKSGYRIELILTHRETHRTALRCDWGQSTATELKSWRIYPGKPAPAFSAGAERFVSGANRRAAYNPKGAVEAALALHLDPAVLRNPDCTRACFRINPGATADQLQSRLQVRNANGDLVFDRAVNAKQSDDWQSLDLPAADWPDGFYSIALYPELDGKVWPEGPVLNYHRSTPDPAAIPVSPYSPFSLRRDPQRATIVVDDFTPHLAEGWVLSGTGLVTKPQHTPEPVALTIEGSGLHAVFITPAASGCYIQLGPDGLIRVAPGPLASRENNGSIGEEYGTEVFVALAELPRDCICIHGPDQPTELTTGLLRIRLEPVTTESAELFRTTTRDLPLPLNGVNDWGCYFHGSGTFIPPRMQADQFDTIIGAQAEVGIHAIDWSVGRSALQYNSTIPDIPIIPVGPTGVDPLDEMIRSCKKFGSSPHGWYALMYYGESKSPQRNEIFQRHPQFRRWLKNADGPDSGETAGQLMSYYFPEIRADKVRPLVEVAERGAEALLLCSIRLAPLMDYHPEMVAAYREAFDIDPNSITDSTSPEFQHWIKWRADFFTSVLRELREGLKPVEQAQSRKVRIGMRLPSSGIEYNLIEGMDVVQWLDEGLVDYLQVAGLESLGGPQCNGHSIRPYVELGQRHGIPVFGAIGATWNREPAALPTILRRVHGMHQAGVDGIEIYESETIARCSHYRWTTPLLGQPEMLTDFIKSSNLEACYPISARTCLFGYDNHARWFMDGLWTWFPDGNGPNCL